jgi:hypothetical protein
MTEPNAEGSGRVENDLDADLKSHSDVINGVVVTHAGRPVPEIEAALSAALTAVGASPRPSGLRAEAERISKLPAGPPPAP